MYIHEGIVSKDFLAWRLTNFSSGIRTMTAIIETYYNFNPFRVTNKVLFSDVVVFGHAASDNLFPSIEVSPFYQRIPTSPRLAYTPNSLRTCEKLTPPPGCIVFPGFFLSSALQIFQRILQVKTTLLVVSFATTMLQENVVVSTRTCTSHRMFSLTADVVVLSLQP